ncbi:carbon monoxide-induced hydrogenase [Caulobacter sp. S45]|uniref:hydrogenase large subunit n=1 Tax=Caulobacter sp. S45 TaxID=1641861 RepID=UPI00131CF233|nr:carbon monoxide-induced hydrogenase [Caulobacter sp. S45]
MTRTFDIPIGPLHVALEEPMYFKVGVEGETITALDLYAGHVHRGIEYLTAKRNIYQNMVLLEHVCSLCSNSHPETFAMTLEAIAGIEVPPRAHYLRMIADEIKRTASHMFNVAILAHIIGFDSLFMHVMQAREIMQDVKETIFGNRMDIAANIIGGVRYDLDATSIAFLLNQLDQLEPVLRDEIIPIYATNRSVLSRTKGIGHISRADCVDYGLMGPTARGSGLAYDVRQVAPYSAYGEIEFEAQSLPDGDVWSRAMVRLKEALSSIAILRECVRRLPPGPISAGPLPRIPAGEAIAKTEAPRGELVYYVTTDGTDVPARVRCRVPSYMNWEALKVMMKGGHVSDIPLIVNSIDPCVSCTER